MMVQGTPPRPMAFLPCPAKPLMAAMVPEAMRLLSLPVSTAALIPCMLMPAPCHRQLPAHRGQPPYGKGGGGRALIPGQARSRRTPTSAAGDRLADQAAAGAGNGYPVPARWLTAVVSGGASRPQWRHSSGAGAPAGRGTRAGLVIVNAASRPPATHVAPEMSTAVRKPAASASGCRYTVPVMPASAGSTATASRPPNRATSLLTAEAIPESSAGAELIAVAVSGATVIASPSPNTTTAGST